MKLTLDETQMHAFADLLMGAAYADGEFDGMEAGEIADILHEVIGDYPGELSLRLSQFAPEDLDIRASAGRLASLSKGERQAILALLVRVTDSDAIHDLAESEYLREVIDAMGCDTEGFEAQAFEVEIVSPPPLPKT